MMETLGGMCSDAIWFVGKVGQVVSQRDDARNSSATMRQNFGSLSAMLWCGNAALIIRHLPTYSPLITEWLDLTCLIPLVYLLLHLFCSLPFEK